MVKKILNNLNSVQKEAVTTTDGPLLVLAGAGTGKTKVLTSKCCYIIKENLALPFQILAVTFTNKAALEMKERISHLLGECNNDLWIGTFHSIGLKILRKFYDKINLKNNFIILDAEDTNKVLKDVLLEFNIDIKFTPVKKISSLISRLKDKALFPEDLTLNDDVLINNTVKLSNIYKRYAEQLKYLNAVDFNDLLLLCIKLFKKNKEALEFYQNKFKYILVDEYQDTNVLQYKLLKLLSLKHNNICCVGDDDQSIYSWRGAEIANILSFQEDYPNARVLRLEENYRSTNPILETASLVISNNGKRWGKNLWTSKEGGQKIIINECIDSTSEAKLISEEISNFSRNGYNYNEIAILVRAGYQTREIEESLLKNHISYKIVGSNKFYERLEIKDVLAYLRLCLHPDDNIALERVINTPKRGIGSKVLEKIQEVAKSYGISYFEAVKVILQNQLITGKVINELQRFVDLITHYQQLINKVSLPELAEHLIEEAGYLNMWRNEKGADSKTRLDNINELLNSLEDFKSLEEYLEHVSLLISIDDFSDDNKVSVMTLHAAKGLEFHVVFLSGWEEGIFPSSRAVSESEGGLEEERRLAYVGITRAKEHLIVSYSKRRVTFGHWQDCVPSRFIKEMGTKHTILKKQSSFLDNYEYDSLSGYKLGYRSKIVNISKNSWDDFFTTKKSNKINSFSKGTIVKHSEFGIGTVKKQDGPLLSIVFEDFGVKTIMADYLTKI